ncbi:MAG: putative selenate reductase subunit YgfK [Candidatus Cloacimonadota bacterium]|nr:putative selenate reductase subunit YgfK [Candidatus Cloacimonadota bacterium]
MSDIMQPVKFKKLLNWILKEYEKDKTIFGIPESKFYKKNNTTTFDLFGEKCETPIGPAAGPHTQSTPNIVVAYLTGSRFFELKTVQILDELDIEKPCIEAGDEGYNTEWSTELTVNQAYAEYIKAWFLVHLMNEMFGLSKINERAFIFNMSVGYDLKGIKSPKIDNFIEELKDASKNKVFQQCKTELKETIKAGKISNITDPKFVETISPKISNSITLSTMHGCPPEDQEAICKYFISEKKMHTFVKLNPTLHGYEYVKDVFEKAGFDHITLKEESFTHDMQYEPAVEMLHTLADFAKQHGVQFGVKLSNTLAVKNDQGMLPTDEMYMSGRTLYPLTINLAKKLTEEFNGNLPISYSGGANYSNIKEIFNTGIRPITMATELLKPGGYSRLTQIAELLDDSMQQIPSNIINLGKLTDVANDALTNKLYKKDYKSDAPMKIDQKLPVTDCFIAPCTIGCPINQDIPEYIRLVGEKRYEEALELIVSKNPLPFITGFICDHNCMLKCVRNDYEEPVLIREMKRIAAENGFDDFLKNMKISKTTINTKVAVIGAGPAGLSSAYFLAREGFDVTIFDSADKPGGTVTNTIPGFRIPSWAIDNDIKLIKNMGVKFKMNSNADFNVAQLKKDGFKYINIAIGAMNSRMLKVEGDQDKVLSAIKFLKNFNADVNALDIGENVAVVGGGNSAMDSARAAKRVPGVKNVYVIYRRTIKQMPADREELEFAMKDGIEFNELVNPASFQNGILKCQVMKLGEKDDSGRRRPIPVEGKFEDFKIDTVLSAIGEIVDYNILEKNKIEVKNWNITIDKYNETNIENVFVSGDALLGPATVVEAIAEGQKITNGILKKEDISMHRVEAENFKFDGNKRLLEIADKKAVIASTKEEMDEPNRCLECNIVCNKCVEVCPNRANVAIYINSDKFKDINQILHIDGLCNECGNCETFCPYDGAPYKDKFTLFWTEKDFNDSKNDGFLLINEDIVEFKVRLADQIFNARFGKNGEIIGFEEICKDENKDECWEMLEIIRTVWKNYNYLLT